MFIESKQQCKILRNAVQTCKRLREARMRNKEAYASSLITHFMYMRLLYVNKGSLRCWNSADPLN